MGLHQKRLAAHDLAAQVRLIRHIHIEYSAAATAFQVVMGHGVEIETVRSVRNRDMQNLALLRQDLQVPIHRCLADEGILCRDLPKNLIRSGVIVHPANRLQPL